jgi:hypothetical protein
MDAMTVLHVVRAFSAQPTLGAALPDARVVELPLADALGGHLVPDLVWMSSAQPGEVLLLRRHLPRVGLLATLPRLADPDEVVLLFAHGADLVLRDEGVLLAAAGLQSLARRRSALPG